MVPSKFLMALCIMLLVCLLGHQQASCNPLVKRRRTADTGDWVNGAADSQVDLDDYRLEESRS